MAAVAGNSRLDSSACGLDSLLAKPRLAKDLDTFARRLLTPLQAYDATHRSHLTDTFVLAQRRRSSRTWGLSRVGF